MFVVTKKSLNILQKVVDSIDNQTFHHHYHILYDIANSYDPNIVINYVEIGCFAGGSACLMLQRPNTNVISIDIGYPIKKETVLKNVDKLNVHNNKYHYILGNSSDPNTIAELKKILKTTKIDILFIDGDHSYLGVTNDFNNYEQYVNFNGYIVFDDYNDNQYSPEVKQAVSKLNFKNYDIIGEFGSEFKAKPSSLINNELVLKKRTPNNCIAIVIATYFRSDGNTKFYLDRALQSLAKQTNQKFKVFLIGDKYENEIEFLSYKNQLSNIYIENLSYAKEREKYVGNQLWCAGGVNAVNYGIDKALSEGYEWIISMDHDDYFTESHIDDIYSFITEDCIFICSKSTYINLGTLPRTDNINYIPSGESLIKSSACVNFKKIPIRFRDVYAETNTEYPSDADFWNRLKIIIVNNNYKSFCTNNITCIHDTEGYSKKITIK